MFFFCLFFLSLSFDPIPFYVFLLYCSEFVRWALQEKLEAQRKKKEKNRGDNKFWFNIVDEGQASFFFVVFFFVIKASFICRLIIPGLLRLIHGFHLNCLRYVISLPIIIGERGSRSCSYIESVMLFLCFFLSFFYSFFFFLIRQFPSFKCAAMHYSLFFSFFFKGSSKCSDMIELFDVVNIFCRYSRELLIK